MSNLKFDRGLPPADSESPFSASSAILLAGVLALALYGAFTLSLPTMFLSASVGAILLPRNILPSLALWLVVVLPISVMAMPTPLSKYFTPAVLVIAVWLIRVAAANRVSLLRVPIRGWLILVPLLVLVLVSALESERPDLTAAWLSVVAICVVLPAVFGQISADDVWPAVRVGFASIGVFLGVLAIAEFFFHFNPWMDLIRYDIGNQTWSVFRTRASLGHPLTMATVSSVALMVCIFPGQTIRRWPYWIGAAGAFVAVLLSVSRTSVFAIGAGAVVGILAARPRQVEGKSRRLNTVVLLAALSAAVAFSPLLSRRSESSEGLGSAAYRSDILEKSMSMVLERPLLGFGPGTAYTMYSDRYASYSSMGRLENSALQLVISIGIPAAVLFLAGLAVVVIVALRRARPGVAAALTAFFITVTGYNALDVNPAILVLAAPLIYSAVVPTVRNAAATVPGRPVAHSGLHAESTPPARPPLVSPPRESRTRR